MLRLAAQQSAEAPRICRLVGATRRSILRALARQAHPFGLTAPEFRVLLCIESSGGKSVRALAQAEQMGEPSVSRILTLLGARGLVLAEIHAENRRALSVRVTESGHRLLERMRAAAGDVYAAQTEGIALGDLRTTAAVLQRIVENMERFVDRRPDFDAQQPVE
jgi:DNA-binding MarR family transcriptional regulator